MQKYFTSIGSWLRQHKMMLLAVFSLLTTPLLFLLEERIRGSISLAWYIRGLAARGEKVSPRDFSLPPTAGENGASEVLAAIKDLTAGTILPKSYPPRMKLTPAGRAVIGFEEDKWIEEKITNRWDQLALDLATNQTTLD